MDTQLGQIRASNNLLCATLAVYHDAAQRFGLSDGELNILYALCELGNGSNQSALFRRMGMEKSTGNSAIHRLCRKGLLTLKPGQGRNVCVFFTPEGESLANRTAHRLLELENEIYAQWSPEEWTQYLALNQRFLDALKEKVRTL